ncbi:MAG TPA: hypothetical protein VI636_24190 [Candidatus Angelobacter sp.]
MKGFLAVLTLLLWIYKIGKFRRPDGRSMMIVDYAAMPVNIYADHLGQLRKMATK